MPRLFASDNYAPAHPTILEALTKLETDHEHSYGDDPVTKALGALLEELFFGSNPGHQELGFFPVFTGTAANVLGLSLVVRPGDSVLASSCAHIATDEGGALEALVGAKITYLPTDGSGKIKPGSLGQFIGDRGNVHRAQPRVLSLTQSTELGGVYTPDELQGLCTEAHDLGLLVHLDGARLGQSIAAILYKGGARLHSQGGVDPIYIKEGRELLQSLVGRGGVDILSLGATKNGAVGAEVLVCFVDQQPGWRRDLMVEAKKRLPFAIKTFMQLSSKTRYLSAQVLHLYQGGLWLENGLKAVHQAQRLAQGLVSIPSTVGIRVLEATANAVFAILPRELIPALQEIAYFYVWDEGQSLVRIMTSWDTEQADIDHFLAKLRSLISTTKTGEKP